VLTPAKHYTSTKWLTVAPPYIPDAVLPGICPDQRFTISLDWLKGLGDGLGHAVCQAMELYRNQGFFKHASRLRWSLRNF
jgi:hypothetical protein